MELFKLQKVNRKKFNIKILKKAKKTAQKIGYQISTYNIPDIWKDTQGEGITVAVIDSTPKWSPVLCRTNDTKEIMVLSIEEIFKSSTEPTIVTEKGEEIKKVNNLSIFNGYYKQGGNWEEIKHVIRHFWKGELKRINTGSGIVDVTPNHSVVDHAGNVIDAEKVSTETKLCHMQLKYLSDVGGNYFWGHKDVAWLFGFWLAEGSAYHVSDKKDTYNITVCNSKIDLLQKCAYIFLNHFNVHSRITRGDDSTQKLIIENKNLFQFFTKYCLCGKQKRVPNFILNAPKEIKIEFLRGYNQSDEHNKERSHCTSEFRSFTTNSQMLACGLTVLIKQCLNQKYDCHFREDKKDVIQISLSQPGSTKNRIIDVRKVKKIFDIKYDDYVYDLETNNHFFGCGTGLNILHNTGFTPHIDFGDSVTGGKNFSDSSTIEDKDSHSSHVSGIITANNNKIGVVGVAPKSHVICIKALNDKGEGAYDWIAKAIRYAVDNKVDIISMSLGGPDDVGMLHDAVKYAYNKNIPIIVAAGNSGDTNNLDYPGRYPETISIGAIDERRLRAGFSQTGPNLDFMSPGVSILSTVPVNDYAIYSGTCLTRNAFVYTENGPVSIANIESGNKVYSYNENTETIELKIIKKSWSNGCKKVRKIYTNRTSLECTNNHPILTKSGWKTEWKRADEIKKGDFIICCQGIPIEHKTVSINPMPMWRTEVSKSLGVSRRHVRDKNIKLSCRIDTAVSFLNKKYGLKYYKAKPILDAFGISDDEILYSTGTHSKINLPKMNKKLAYLCGFYLGNGWITKYNRNDQISPNGNPYSRKYGVLSFAECNIKEINQRIVYYMKEVFLSEPKKHNRQFTYNNTLLADIFEQLCGHDSAKNKKIPPWIYKYSNSIISSFISGLIDSDGYKINCGHRFSSCSPHLAFGIGMLCDYAGIRKNNPLFRQKIVQSPNSKKPKLANEYYLGIHIGPDDFDGIKVNEHYAQFENYRNTGTLISTLRTEKVKKIEIIGEREVFDVEVEDNHSFICNNIIVHNSMATPWASGVVALMMSKHKKIGGKTPVETVEHVREHLKKTAIDLNKAGKDNKTGYGLIDVYKAITQIQGETNMVLTELQQKFNDWITSCNADLDRKKEIEAELAAINEKITACEQKAAQIEQLLN